MTQAHITDLSDTSRKLSLCVPASELQQAFTTRLQRMQKRVKVNGFRPGKVPLSVIRQMYGQNLLAETADSLANDKLRTAIREHKIEPINIGKVNSLPKTPHEEWNFEITFDVIPSFSLPQPEKLQATLVRAEVSEADVDNTLERIRESHPDYSEVARAIAEGDYARIDFSYQLADGDAAVPELDPAKIKNTDLSGSFANERWKISQEMPVAGMCDQLVGLGKDEEKKFSLQVDDNNPNQLWRGKTMHVYVRVLAVEEQSLPELNAEFAARLGIKDAEDALAELRARTRKDLQTRLEARLKSVNKEKLFASLIEATQVELPQSVVDHHNVLLRREMVSRFLPQQELKKDPHPENRLQPELFADKAKERAKLAEVFARFVREHKLEASQDEIRRVLANAASEYDDPEEFVRQATKNRQQMHQYALVALEEVAYNFLVERCQTSWEEKGMDEVFATQPGAKTDEEDRVAHTQPADQQQDPASNDRRADENQGG